MGEPNTPTKPGWYPHRYGEEGKQSYWDGNDWTGESRATRRAGVTFWAALAGSLGLMAALMGLVGSALAGPGGVPIFWGGLATIAVTVTAVTYPARRRPCRLAVASLVVGGVVFVALVVNFAWAAPAFNGWTFGASSVLVAGLVFGVLVGGVVALSRWLGGSSDGSSVPKSFRGEGRE